MTILMSVSENFTKSLVILAQGMGGIFLFMALFYGLIRLLERVFREKKQ